MIIMLTAVYLIHELRWFLPASFLLGSSTTFVTGWFPWRLLTAILPSKIYYTGDDIFYSLYQRLILFFFEHYTGLKVVLYGDTRALSNKKENVIFISNHQSTVDWIIADMLACRQGTIGHIRYILKDGLKYFPLYGFYFRQHSCIYVKRSGKFRQRMAEDQLDEIVSSKLPYWMVVFPEGTRHNMTLPHVIQKSRKFARDSGAPVLEHLLTPRYKATHLCVNNLRPTVDAVYDVTVAYSNTSIKDGRRIESPGLVEFLQGHSKELHIHIDRVPISEVPTSEDDVKHWLYDRFQKKDKLLARFYSPDPAVAGTLGNDGKLDKLPWKHTLPVFLLFAAAGLPLVATETGRSFYWKTTVLLTLTGWFWVTIRL